MNSTIGYAAIAATIAFGAAGATLWWTQHSHEMSTRPIYSGAPETAENSTTEDTVGADIFTQPYQHRPSLMGKAPDKSRGDLAARVEALEIELGKLNERQGSISRDVDHLVWDDARSTDMSNSVDLADDERTPEELVDQAEAEVEAQVDVIEQTIKTEGVDSDWAPEALLALHEVFSSEEMAEFEVIEADCRTTLCRVDVAIDPSVSMQDSHRRLIAAAPWNGYGFFRINEDPPEATYYLAREGDMLPAATVEISAQ